MVLSSVTQCNYPYEVVVFQVENVKHKYLALQGCRTPKKTSTKLKWEGDRHRTREQGCYCTVKNEVHKSFLRTNFFYAFL